MFGWRSRKHEDVRQLVSETVAAIVEISTASVDAIGRAEGLTAARAAVDANAAALGLAPLAPDWRWTDVLERSAALRRFLSLAVYLLIDIDCLQQGVAQSVDAVLWAAIEAHPESPAPVARLAARLDDRGDLAGAEKLLVEFLRLHPGNAEVAGLYAYLAAKNRAAPYTFSVLSAVARANVPAAAFFDKWLEAIQKTGTIADAEAAVEAAQRQLGVAPLAWNWTWPAVLEKSGFLRRSLPLGLCDFLDNELVARGDDRIGEEVLRITVQAHPRQSGRAIRLAERLYARERRLDGDALLTQFLEREPGNPAVLSCYARQAAARGAMDVTAGVLARAAASQASADPLLPLWLEACMKAGDLLGARRAIESCAKQLALDDLPPEWRWADIITRSARLRQLLEPKHYMLIEERLSETGEATQAHEMLQALRNAEPGLGAPVQRMARRLQEKGDSDAAAAMLAEFLARNPAQPQVAAQFAQLAAAAGATMQTHRTLEACVRAGLPAETAYAPWLASCLNGGDLAMARRVVEICAPSLGLAPLGPGWMWPTVLDAFAAKPHISFYNQLDEALLATGRRDEADAVTTCAVAAYPGFSGPALRLAHRHYASGHARLGDDLLRSQLLRTPGDMHSVLTYARLLAKRGDLRQAVDVLRAGFDAGVPAANLIAPWLAACFRARDFAGAREAVEACANQLELAPLTVGWTWPHILRSSAKLRASLPLADYYVIHGFCLEAGDRESANAVLAQAVAAYPALSGPVLQLALDLYEHETIDSGDQVLKDYLARNPADDLAVRIFVARLRSRAQFGIAREVLAAGLAHGASLERLAPDIVGCHLELGQAELARKFLEDSEREGTLAMNNRWLWADVIAIEGDIEGAATLLDAALGELPADYFALQEIRTKRDHLRVRADTAQVLKTAMRDSPPKGVAIVISNRSPLLLIWTGLALRELRKHDFAPVILDRHQYFPIDPTGDSAIDEMQGLVDYSGTRLQGETSPRLRHEWTIDPGNETISALGFNFFRPIVARIGTAFRRYTLDLQHPVARAYVQRFVAQADTALSVCERAEATLAARGLQVRFLSDMTHYVPGAVYKAWCASRAGIADMAYVEVSSANELYFSNLANRVTTAISARNLTRYPHLRSSCDAVPEHFFRWRANLTSKAPLMEEVKAIVALDRSRSDHLAAAAARRRIMAHRLGGGRVVCMFGKMLYDVLMDIDAGPAHKNMQDWIDHTIQTLADSDVMLLVKPHPYELNPEISRPQELFCDLLPRSLPANILPLDHRWFNLSDMLKLIDAGVKWNGSAALELQSQGIPAIVCSHWAQDDVTMNFARPRNRAEYERMIRDPGALRVSPEVRENAALLIKYTSTDEIVIPYGYANMPYLRGVDAGAIRWNMETVAAYIEHGDPYISELARRCM